MRERITTIQDNSVLSSLMEIAAYNRVDHKGLMQILKRTRAKMVRDKAAPQLRAFWDELIIAAKKDNRAALASLSGQ